MIQENYQVSVVIPMYNAEGTITRTLNSALSQSEPPLEILVVDDGSTDSSLAKISNFLGVGPDALKVGIIKSGVRVRIINQTNKGVGHARNAGIEKAKSPWVALLDSDDVWLPNHLREISVLISTFPDSHLVSTKFRRSPLPGTNDSSVSTLGSNYRTINYFDEASRDIGVVSSSTAAIRRDTFLSLGGFGTWKIGEDLEMWARVALKYTIAHSDHVTVIYMQHDQSAMAQFERQVVAPSMPKNFRDISPACDIVAAALNAEQDQLMVETMHRFINQIIQLHVRRSLVLGHIEYAKALVAFAYEPQPGIVKFISLAPRLLLQIASITWRTVRPLFRKRSLRSNSTFKMNDSTAC